MQLLPAIRFIAELSESANAKCMTCKWIAGQETEERQLQGIKDILSLAKSYAKWVNDMVTEAWAILVDKQLWKIKYHNKQDAMAAMDSPALQDIRRRAGISKDWKTGYTAKIRENWPGHTANWKITELGEHYLAYVTTVSQWYTFEEVSKIVPQIAKKRIKRSCGGRALTKTIIGHNWQDMREIDWKKALALSNEGRIPAGQFHKLTCHIELALGRIDENDDANDDTHNDTPDDDNDNDGDNNDNDGNKDDNESGNNDNDSNDNDDADGHDASDSTGNSNKSRAHPAG